MDDLYDADYFLRGKQTGKSLYEDYRWLPELTVPMVMAITGHLRICSGANGVNFSGPTILDFGCARGYVVKAFRELGYQAYGYDVSKWAVENADKDVYHFLTTDRAKAFSTKYDWIIAKDVLEHVPYVANCITELLDTAVKGVFAVVPLSPFDNTPYTVPEYEKDVTHIQRRTLITWIGMFLRPGWSVEASYRVQGIKDNYAQYPKGNGFITARRLHA